MSKGSFAIRPLELSDVPTIARMSAEAFEQDRQTIMKGLGSEAFFMEEHTLTDLPRRMQNPRIISLKAVENSTDKLMGYICWAFRGFSTEEIPVVEGRVQPLELPPVPIKTGKEEDQATAEPDLTEAEKARRENPIQKLIALQDRDMQIWEREIMPDGVRCLYVAGLMVVPEFQRRGAGSALLRYGTKFCDEKGVFAWVHSSEMAWKAYEKTGFQVIRSLDCDLDEYAPMPPPGEGPDAKWGHYILRYMKYLPTEEHQVA